MIPLLLAAGMAGAAQIPDLDEAFRREIREGNYAAAEKLLEDPALDPDSRGEKGWTALMHAARSDEPEILELLLKAGVNLDLANGDGETALIIAVREENVDAARRLLMAGADLSPRDGQGRTALDWAERKGHTYLSQIIRIAGRPSMVKVTVAEKPVDLGGESLEPPRVVKETPPLYTESAFDRGIEGTVVLKVIVRKDGSVGPIRVQQGLERGLDQAAIEALRMWRFEPAKVGGEPINVLANVEFDFILQKKT